MWINHLAYVQSVKGGICASSLNRSLAEQDKALEAAIKDIS